MPEVCSRVVCMWLITTCIPPRYGLHMLVGITDHSHCVFRHMVKNLSFPTWQDHMARSRDEWRFFVLKLCGSEKESLSQFRTESLWKLGFAWHCELKNPPKQWFMVMLHDIYIYTYINVEKKHLKILKKNHEKRDISRLVVQLSCRKKEKKNGGRKLAKQR